MENLSSSQLNAMAGAKPGSSSVEKQYVKMSQLEHILKRPDTYIGSIEATSEEMWLFNKEKNQMEKRECTFVPGLYKIFDEILVNAADNKQRDPTMDTLKVAIDLASNAISVYNNGKGIPIVMHSEHGVYIPEMIFGQLLTSSNYDDNEQRTTGGRNGYGAKLTNIFSEKFELETVDSSRGLKYQQVWKRNMSWKSEPVISKISAKDGKGDYTKVTFIPDLAKFGGMTSLLDNDIVQLIYKRVYDVAGTSGSGLKVFLDGERIPVKHFKDYMSLYFPEGASEGGSEHKLIYEKVNDRWEFGLTFSDGSPQQVSFVNSILTSQGGSHVDYLTDQVAKSLVEHIQKKHKTTVKPMTVKNHLFLFVNCLIVNPAFETQTKVKLKMNRTAFGSKCELDDKVLKQIQKSSIVEHILAFAQFQSAKDIKKVDGKKSKRIAGIPKLEDANEAGGKYSSECTLILTEGDSAKALAVSGLAIVGRDRYGVFPLKGKLLNVRECEKSKAVQNEEIANLIKILGLQSGKKYTDTKDLRYGHVMIMTDQDHDGSHIKGLLINMFSAWWPELMRMPGFLQEFITPIVKVKKGSGNREKSINFYTIPEFEQWKVENEDGAGWTIKYYKGLGTSTSAEAKEYFSSLLTHQLSFRYESQDCDKAIELAFSKSKADARKEWLTEFKQGTFLDQSKGVLTYKDFVHKELILFSVASNLRAIPSMVDGLKPGQRKILYVCFTRNLTKEIKVAQLAGSVSEKSAYHHGEASLTQTIVGMAQNFVGSNNINFLVPSGQFGTRLAGGKDAASARYIFTYLTPITRALFPQQDDVLLDYLNDDGLRVEPEWYLPIVPTVLVNGSSGIGTGWSSSIPNYNPRDLISQIRRLLDGQECEAIHPWYRGFKGSINYAGKNEQNGDKYVVYGRIERLDGCTYRISELPIQFWTADHKVLLESMIEAKEIQEFKEHHTDTTVSFTIKCTEEQWKKIEEAGVYKKLKLSTTLSCNMMLFDAQGHIKKYDSAVEIVKEFYQLRLQYYHRRKANLVEKLSEDCDILKNRVRYIKAVRSGELKLTQTNEQLLAQLVKDGYKRVAKKRKARTAGESDDQQEADDSQETDETKAANGVPLSDFYYLVNQTQLSLTVQNAARLSAECDAKQKELNQLLITSPEDMWRTDLDKLSTALEDFEREEEAAAAKDKKAVQKKKPAKRADSDDDDDDFDDDWGKKKKSAPKQNKSSSAAMEIEGELIEPPPVTEAKVKEKREKKEKPAKEEKEKDENAAAKPKVKREKKEKTAKGGDLSEEFQHITLDDDDEEDEVVPIVREARPARRAAAEAQKKYVEKESDGEEDEDEEEEEDEEESMEEDDDEDFDDASESAFSDESDFEESPVKKNKKNAAPKAKAPAPAPAAKAAAKPAPAKAEKPVAKAAPKEDKKEKAPAKRALKKTKDDSDDDEVEYQPAPVKTAPAPAAAPVDMTSLSLTERLALKMKGLQATSSAAPASSLGAFAFTASAPAAKSAAAPEAVKKVAGKQKKAATSNPLSSPISPKETKKPRTQNKKAIPMADDEDEDLFNFTESKATAAPAKNAKTAKAAAAPVATTGRPQRARTQVKYVEESSEEEEEEEESEFDEEEDEDDDY